VEGVISGNCKALRCAIGSFVGASSRSEKGRFDTGIALKVKRL